MFDSVVLFAFAERKWKHPKVMPVATLEAFCFNISMPQFSYFKKCLKNVHNINSHQQGVVKLNLLLFIKCF